MKNIFKRNQIIITALVIMVIIAAYINFAGSKFNKEDLLAEASSQVDGTVDTTDISEEDVASADNVNVLGSEQDLLADTGEEANEDTALTEIPSLDSEADVASTESAATTETAQATDTTGTTDTTGNPGEAVFTGATSEVGFAAEAKLAREQVRAENKDVLLEIINNTNISDEQKQKAIDSMIALTDIAEKENAAETLLESQGFSQVVVSLTDDTADVVVSKAEITDANRAQIEDIITRKTGVAVENITITPME